MLVHATEAIRVQLTSVCSRQGASRTPLDSRTCLIQAARKEGFCDDADWTSSALNAAGTFGEGMRRCQSISQCEHRGVRIDTG